MPSCKLVKANGKYAVEIGGMAVALSAEKQEKLAKNNAPEGAINLEA